MNQLGIGVMISRPGGNEESAKTFVSSNGKVILSARIENNSLRLEFNDDTAIEFFDDGQSCCESRYMVCDDDLPYFSGATLVSAELADAPEIEDEYGVHEVQFLRVATSKGTLVVSNHNEHNGYYGGFALRVRKG